MPADLSLNRKPYVSTLSNVDQEGKGKSKKFWKLFSA
jgi:hypothetical protein